MVFIDFVIYNNIYHKSQFILFIGIFNNTKFVFQSKNFSASIKSNSLDNSYVFL